MIHLKEETIDHNTIAIMVSGVLDRGAVPILKSICHRHLSRGKRVLVDLEALVHITRDGRGFVQEWGNRVGFMNLPEFMNPEHHT